MKKMHLFITDCTMWFADLSMLIACVVHASYGLGCEQNQNGQSMSFFKTNGDLSLTGKSHDEIIMIFIYFIPIRFAICLWRVSGFFDIYDEKCSGPTPTGIHSMEMVATVVQILNSIHYIPGITLGRYRKLHHHII